MNVRNMTCINCPMGCTLEVIIDNDNIKVSGNKCKRGIEYAEAEIREPKRIVTSTIRVIGGDRPLVAVKTDKEISKDMIYDVMNLINKKSVKAPVKIGDILIENILGTDVNIVATSNVKCVC